MAHEPDHPATRPGAPQQPPARAATDTPMPAGPAALDPSASPDNAPHAGADRQLELPELIEVEPTGTCNLRCIMCVTQRHLASGHTEPMLDVDQFLRWIEPLRGRWVTIGSAFEPTCHPRFDTLIRGLAALDMKIDLVTNATQLTPARLDTLRACAPSLRNLTLSFDGIRKDTYEHVRRGARFERTVANIEGLLEAVSSSRPRTCINYVIMRSTLPECTEAVHFWNARGIDQLSFLPMYRSQAVLENLDEGVETLLEACIEAVFGAARAVLEGDLPILLASPFFSQPHPLKEVFPQAFGPRSARSTHPASRPALDVRSQAQGGEYPGMAVRCRSPFNALRVTWNGHIYLCHNKFRVGTLGELPFEEVWSGRYAWRVRDSLRKDPHPCYHGCDYYRFCVLPEEQALELPSALRGQESLSVREGVYLAPTYLERRGYHHLFGYLGMFYGVPAWAQYVHLELKDFRDHPGILKDPTLEGLYAQVSAYYVQPHPLGRQLQGYQLVLYLGKAYGLATCLGALNLTRVASGPLESLKRMGFVLTAESTDALEQRIRTLGVEPLEQGYCGYNLFRQAQGCLAVQSRLRLSDVLEADEETTQQQLRDGERIWADSEDGLRTEVDARLE